MMALPVLLVAAAAAAVLLASLAHGTVQPNPIQSKYKVGGVQQRTEAGWPESPPEPAHPCLWGPIARQVCYGLVDEEVNTFLVPITRCDRFAVGRSPGLGAA
jgi:hypothetical protein